jgi:hypothetical protein
MTHRHHELIAVVLTAAMMPQISAIQEGAQDDATAIVTFGINVMSDLCVTLNDKWCENAPQDSETLSSADQKLRDLWVLAAFFAAAMLQRVPARQVLDAWNNCEEGDHIDLINDMAEEAIGLYELTLKQLIRMHNLNQHL